MAGAPSGQRPRDRLALCRHALAIQRNISERNARFFEAEAEKLAGQKQINAEAQRNQKRRSLFDVQDQVDKQRDELIQQIEGKLNQTTTMQPLFMLRRALG